MLRNADKLWKAGDLESRQRLQRLLFPAGAVWDPEKQELRTPEIISVFRNLRTNLHDSRGLVEQKGLEPSTPTMRTWCSPS